MAYDVVASLRSKADRARRLAYVMKQARPVLGLLRFAEELEAEAKMLEEADQTHERSASSE